MKVTGPGSGAPPEAANDAADASPAGETGRAFAETLDGSRASGPTSDAAASAVSEIAAALDAGRLTPVQAVDQIVARVVNAELGKGAPAALRERLEAILRATLADDPVLARKVRALE